MFIYCEAALCLMSILIRGGLYIHCKRLLRDSRNMEEAHSSMLKRLKSVYADEYSRFQHSDNVNMFVYKFMFENKVLGMRISGWESIGVLNILICSVLAGLAAIDAFRRGYDNQVIIMNVMCGFVSGFLIVLSDLATNIQGKIDHLHVNICLYIENELRPVLERKYTDNHETSGKVSEEIDAGIIELFRLMNEDKAVNVKDSKRKPVKREAKNKSETKAEDDIINEVIEEYLV